MEENYPVEISLSKSKLTKFLIFSLLFLAGGIWMIVSNPQTNNPFFNNLFIKGLAMYGSTIMGLAGVYFFTRKLLDNKPGLIINEKGIHDNTSIFKFGWIPWSDIADIYEHSIQASIASKQYFITIGLKNPEEYIVREVSPIKRKLMQVNANSYGSPVHISTNGLKINHHELLELLRGALNKYRN
jgi:hypothetical protein